MVRRAGEIAAETGAYWTDQFNNTDMIQGYRRIGEELLGQLPRPPVIDAFCSYVGTAGCFLGTVQALRQRLPALQRVVGEPAESAGAAGGPAGEPPTEGGRAGPPAAPRLISAARYAQNAPSVRGLSNSSEPIRAAAAPSQTTPTAVCAVGSRLTSAHPPSAV